MHGPIGMLSGLHGGMKGQHKNIPWGIPTEMELVYIKLACKEQCQNTDHTSLSLCFANTLLAMNILIHLPAHLVNGSPQACK